MFARNRTTTVATATTLAVILGLGAVGVGGEARAQDRVQWKMQSAFPSNLSHVGTSGVRMVEAVEIMSSGTLELKYFEPGALVPALECFDAASKGSLESCWTTPGFHTGKYPALAFFTAVPFGPGYGEVFAWKLYGGGNELQQEIYGRHGLRNIDCNATGPETSGWFREQIGGVEDLKGLKMRFFGLGARVMTKLGVSTQLLAAADIYPALERGVIDATEFAMPNMDIDLGFHQIAKFNYYPGWHQPVSLGELLMNLEAWNALSDAHKKILEVACGWNLHVNFAETEALNPQAMNEMMEKYGVTNVRWSDEDLAAFETAWLEVLEEEAAADPDFKTISESYLAFRKVYKTWGDAQSLNATYLD